MRLLAVSASSNPHPGAAFRPLLVGAGLGNFDRFVIGPMLVVLAASFDTDIKAVTVAATAYFVAYGLSQPVWGVVSDRWGRVRTARGALVVAGVGNITAAAAVSIPMLALTRGVAGAAMGAVIPATITYIGDTLPLSRRQHALSDMLAAMAVGSTLATITAGAIAQYLSWRLAFAGVAVVCFVELLVLTRAGDEPRTVATTGLSTLGRFAAVLGNRWALLVMGLVVAEGAMVLGVFAVIPAAMERAGATTATAGVLAGVYGLSVLAATRIVKRLAHTPVIPLLLGGICLAGGNAFAAFVEGVWPLLVACVLFGVTWAGFHSSLQAWMTSTVPAARATAVALMTTALFLGSGLGSTLGGWQLQAGQLSALFGWCLVVAVVITVVAVVGRWRYHPPAEV